MRYGDHESKRFRPKESKRNAGVRSDESEGDEPAQEALKGILPPLLGDAEQEQDGTLKIIVGHDGVVHW